MFSKNSKISLAIACGRWHSFVAMKENNIFSPSLRFVVREGESQYKVNKPTLDSPENLFQFFTDVVSTDENYEAGKESLILYCLNTRLELIGYSVVHVGTINETNCNPAAILRAALLSNSYAISISHGHPSGDPSPSQADRTCTQRLDEACTMIGIRLIDHLITGEPAPGRQPFYSFRAAGQI